MTELYGQRVQSTIQTSYLPKAVDSILNSNIFFQRIVRASKKWSGRTKRVPVKVSVNATTTSFRGYDTLSTNATDNRIVLEFTPSFHQVSVSLPGDEMSVADTEDKVLDLVKLTIQSDAEDLADSLGTAFYADGTGNSSKDVLGLAAAVDDGTTIATYGGQSRSTYTTLASTVTASSGTLTLAKVDTLWMAVTSGNQKPTAMYTTEAVFNFYGQLLRPQERITKSASAMKGMTGGTGFTALEYNGKPILADEKCTAQAFIMLNEDFVDFYALPAANSKSIGYKSQIDGNDYDAPVGLGFSWSDWIPAQNAYAFVGHIWFGGQLISSNSKRHGKLTGITGI